MLNILFLTKSKKYTCKLLKILNKKYYVIAVVCKDKSILEETEMERFCNENAIQIISNNEMYEMLENHRMPPIDLAISNTYGRLIKKPLIDWVKGNCINLHGAVLPDYKGVFTYNHGLLNGERQWGVTAHYVNEAFDAGNIIEIRKFKINPDKISVSELEEHTQKVAYELTLDLLERWEKNGPLPSTPQPQGGTYYSREDFETAKEIRIIDSASIVRRKIHAFWCPPYEGAYIVIDGEHFPLMFKDEKSDMSISN